MQALQKISKHFKNREQQTAWRGEGGDYQPFENDVTLFLEAFDCCSLGEEIHVYENMWE